MAEYTLKYINHRAECDAEAFVNDCEEHYHRQLHLVADQIAANCKRKPVVLLNGPSSSGKTTTNDRLGRILELAGIHAHMISMDDYYRTSGTYDIPFDKENGVNDLESPECMDLDLLRDHLTVWWRARRSWCRALILKRAPRIATSVRCSCTRTKL